MFIDGAYLDKLLVGPLAEYGKPLYLDMRKLPTLLAGGTRPWRTYYYHAMPWVSDPPEAAEYAAHQRKAEFIRFLSREPRWVIREGVVERRGGTRPGDWYYEQKRSDVQLAVDLTRLAWRGEVTRAILLAGDSDFIPAIEDAKAAGVAVAIRGWPGTIHEDLLKACDDRLPLDATALRGIART